MTHIPHEFAIGGVYMPPLLIAGLLGVVAASLTTRLLNRYRLSKYFFYPPLVYIALVIIYAIIIEALFIGV